MCGLGIGFTIGLGSASIFNSYSLKEAFIKLVVVVVICGGLLWIG